MGSRAGVVVLVLAAALACGTLGPGDLGRVIALEARAPDSLEEYDTLTPHARVLDGRGDSVGATIVWSTADTAPVLTLLDSLTGETVVNRTGQTGQLLARSDGLISNPIAIRTLAAADTLFANVTTVDTVTLSTSPDSLSDTLGVELADTMSTLTVPDSIVPLVGRPIVYAITYPPAPGPVTLVTSDTAHALVTADTVATGASGIAGVRVRLIAGPLPDSVVVTATARRARGATVPGSPVKFVVRFVP